MEFQADSVEYWSQNGIETVVFSNAEKELVLLISSLPGSSDHYLEWNDQSNACTNGVKTVQLSEQKLHIQLLPDAAKHLGLTEFNVEFDAKEDVFKEISRCLSIIFGNRLALKKAETQKKTLPKQDYSGIKYLNLEGQNLTQIPDYIQEMAALETAKLARNPQLDFQAVCEVLAKLPSVRELTFTTEQAVPENIGKLSNLESLSLDGFTSPQVLPEGIGQLKKLKYLLLMSNFDVVLPESFADLVAMEDLNMRSASWQLPSRFYQLSKLKYLDFSNCRFTVVPEEMANMQEVNSVIIGGLETHDYAQLFRVIAQMPNLKTLELNTNPVPKDVGLCRQIEELIIWTSVDAGNPLRLPDELFELTHLKILILSMNHFDEIPAAIGNLKGLEQLIFIGADFENLPDSVGNLPNLIFLNISENPSLRTLPESLGKLTQLKTLYLEDNPHLARLPDSFKNLTNLEEVNIPNRGALANIPENWNRLFI